jgi:hypothetical protein
MAGHTERPWRLATRIASPATLAAAAQTSGPSPTANFEERNTYLRYQQSDQEEQQILATVTTPGEG